MRHERPRRVAIFIGTRPEAIKLAPVVRAMRASHVLEPVVIATAQHRGMLDQAFAALGISADVDLDVMREAQSLAELSARLIERVDAVLETVEVDFALVQGDTSTAMCAALACFYRDVPVGHVEAGLRTHDVRAPFPEEMNRRLIGPLATLHFPTTTRAAERLVAELVDPASVVLAGSTSIDALAAELRRQDAEPDRRTQRELAEFIGFDPTAVPYIAITAHRRESFGRGFEEIVAALAELSDRLPDHQLVYPVHLNPQVRGPVSTKLAGRPNVRLVEPLGYHTFVALLRRSSVILTDSGGIQEEAPSLGVPLVVMRATTERPEGVEAGLATLVGTDRTLIVGTVLELVERERLAPPGDRRTLDSGLCAPSPYGDGRAAERIVAALETHFGSTSEVPAPDQGDAGIVGQSASCRYPSGD